MANENDTARARRLWGEVDRYFQQKLLPKDDALDAALAANAAAGLPEIDVSPLQGRFLELIVRLTKASRILEIGTLGGYSTIWMARATPPGGRVVTLEAEPRHAEIARANFKRAGIADRVDLRVGPALDLLPAVEAEGLAPFDLVFIDADKPSNPDYLRWALKLTKTGSLIIGDNVVRDGAVVDAKDASPGVRGVRRFADLIASEPRLVATAIQTVGVKGWDGFAMALVVDEAR
jgi:predicted O-methyltransferase YrrM